MGAKFSADKKLYQSILVEVRETFERFDFADYYKTFDSFWREVIVQNAYNEAEGFPAFNQKKLKPYYRKAYYALLREELKEIYGPQIFCQH